MVGYHVLCHERLITLCPCVASSETETAGETDAEAVLKPSENPAVSVCETVTVEVLSAPNEAPSGAKARTCGRVALTLGVRDATLSETTALWKCFLPGFEA